MERTNRPTQIGTRAPAGRQSQSRGVGQTGQGQDSEWADSLVRGYDNKMSAENPAAYENGRRERRTEGRPMSAAGPGREERRTEGRPVSTAGLGRERNPAGTGNPGWNHAGGRSMGGTPQDVQAPAGERPYGDGGRIRPGERAYGRGGYAGNRYGQGEQPLGADGNGQRQSLEGGHLQLGPGRIPDGSRAPGPEAASGTEREKREQGRHEKPARGYGDKAIKGGRQTAGPTPTNRDRRPPGASAGKRGQRGSKRKQGGRVAEARGENRGKQAYEAAAFGRRDVQNQDAKAQRRLSTGQRSKPPGSGSTARKKPGSGVNFLVQGSILAAAGIVVRLIGMVYRIPLARKIGDVGNGYYNAAYSIYSILLIMSSYSLPTAVSKMVSARLARGQYRTSTKIFRASMFYATLAGMAGFCALWFGADYFAGEIIKMPYSSYALKSLAPTIWVMAYLGVLRGYFQGHSTMIPTAVSQVFEQVVNAVVSIVAASVLFDMGVKSNLVFHDTEYSYAFGAAGGAIGTGAGALTALVLFLLLTMGYVPTMRKQAKRDRGTRVESYGAISRALFVTIVPIIISSAIYNVSNVVDNSIFGHVMEGMGESGQTASQWGVYMGRYHMLFNIPVAIANSLSSSLIPSLSRAVAEKNRREILSKIGSAIRFSMIIAIPSAVGLTVLAEPVSNLLFSGMDNEMLVQMMAVGSSAVVVFSLSTVSNAILQGINRMQVPIINSAVSLAVHVGALYGMLGIFHMGIYSVVYANILFAALVCVLNAVSIARYTGYRQEVVKTFLVPCGASAAMGGAAWGIHRFCVTVAGNAVSTAAAILAAILVYFVLLIKLKGVDAKELRGMPGGTRLLGVAKKLRLM